MMGVNPESWKRGLRSVQVQTRKITTDRAVKHGSLCLDDLIEKAIKVLKSFVERGKIVILLASN
jgi:hypothetical protein